jgi:tetratricopeptide (TPR) repeat protein
VSALQAIRVLAILVAFLTSSGSPEAALAQRVSPVNRAILARLLLNKNLVDSASSIVEAGLAADSLNPDLWAAKAWIHAARGDRSAELEALRRALAIRPFFTEVHQTLAEVFCDSGLTDSADRYIALPMQADSLNPRVTYFGGRIREQRGELDSAAVMYLRTYELLNAYELLRVPVCPGYRVQDARLHTTGSAVIRLISGRPTLLLFWATWSPESMKAMKAIMQQLPKSGLSWSFLPINVDEWKWRRSTRQRAEAKARELGYKDPVPVDSGLSLFDRFGLVRIPALIATSISGDVDEVEFGWSKNVADRVIKGLLGTADSTSQLPQPPQSDCKPALRLLGAAWHYWEGADPMRALNQVSRVIRTCSTSAYPHVLSATWRWRLADTLRAGRDAYKARRADSTSPWGWLAVAELDRRRNRVDSSWQAVQQALRLDSSLATAWAIAGRLAATANDTVTVRRAALALERLNRVDPALYVLRALLLRSAGSLANAIALWRELLDPRFVTPVH